MREILIIVGLKNFIYKWGWDLLSKLKINGSWNLKINGYKKWFSKITWKNKSIWFQNGGILVKWMLWKIDHKINTFLFRWCLNLWIVIDSRIENLDWSESNNKDFYKLLYIIISIINSLIMDHMDSYGGRYISGKSLLWLLSIKRKWEYTLEKLNWSSSFKRVTNYHYLHDN